MKRCIQRSIPPTLVSSIALLALLTTLTPWTAAQRTAHNAAPRPAIPRFNVSTRNFAFGQNAHHSGFHRSSPHTSLPFPFFGDFFNPDDLYSTGYPVASQPPIILLQAASALTGSSDYLAQPKNDRERSTSSQPLMIERQNGRYVRISSTAANGEALPLEPSQTQAATPSPLPPPKRDRTTSLQQF